MKLLTLTGPGGVGKTRLALQIARNEIRSVDTVWFVALATVPLHSQMPFAIARAVGIPQFTNQSVELELIAYLNQSPGLLILDNVEHLPEAGKLVSTFLQGCPDLKVLVTTRTRLRISGEQIFVVPSMEVPIDGSLPALDEIKDIETVQLFVERAQASSAGFSLTPQNAPAVAAICRQLDGLPLAIELAAARISAFSPRTLRERLGERLTVLADGPRDEAPRLRSMRDSISWSHDLLEADERSVFAQLAVFAGPWTLEAAEAVVSHDAMPGERSVLECVIALVQHNLVRQETTPGDNSSYLMPETIRQFSKELFDKREDVDVVRRLHAEFVHDLAQQAEVVLYQNDGALLFARLRLHLADILQALTWLEQRGDIETLIKIASGLAPFWGMQGHVFEGQPWLERAVALGRATDSPKLGQALIALAGNHHMQGNETLAWTYAAEGLAILRHQDSSLARTVGLARGGIISLRLGDFERSASLQNEALIVIRSMPPASWVTCAESTVLGHLGNIAVSLGDIEAARDYFIHALERQMALGFTQGISHFLASHPIAGLGDVARADRDMDTALKWYQESLELAGRNHDFRATLYALGGIAGTLAAAGEWAVAATLFGACEQQHIRAGFHFDLETMDRQRALGLPEPWLRASQSFGVNQPLRDSIAERYPGPPSSLPDPTSIADLWVSGGNLSLVEAILQALPAKIGPSHKDVSGSLTHRELDVLRLLVQGKTDAEIGSLLFISHRTASPHVRHIYDKLDVSSRAAATAYAVRHGLA